MTTTTNELLVDELNGVTRHKCPECGNWAYAGKAIRHAKRCDCSELQSQEILDRAAKQSESDRLYRFAATVKRTGMASGRIQDLEECVRRGLLTTSDAMNLDD